MKLQQSDVTQTSLTLLNWKVSAIFGHTRQCGSDAESSNSKGLWFYRDIRQLGHFPESLILTCTNIYIHNVFFFLNKC